MIPLKLRDHPLLIYHKVRSWPPAWTFLWRLPGNASPSDTRSTLKGEIGVLKGVRRWDLRENKCFLYIEYEEGMYLGCVLMENSTFCQQLYELLRDCSGRSIKEIGDMDVSHTL